MPTPRAHSAHTLLFRVAGWVLPVGFVLVKWETVGGWLDFVTEEWETVGVRMVLFWEEAVEGADVQVVILF